MEKVNTEGAEFAADEAASELLRVVEEREQELGLTGALFYYDFPIYRDDAGEFVTAKVLIVSAHHGFVVIAPTNATRNNAVEELKAADSQLDNAFSCLYSRLLRNRALRATKTTLSVPDRSLIYAPLLDAVPDGLGLAADVVTTGAALEAALQPGAQQMGDEVLEELLSTIEGAKGLIRPKVRKIAGMPATSKGRTVAEIESAIASFDLKQKTAYVSSPTGVERIRGLAGSGKTVILAMKAALTHLRYPEARIAYTFSTRSLYQHIQRLITRFYRQFHDQDPDWDRLKILHAWGGRVAPGLYSVACEAHGVPALTFRDARVRSARDAFDFVCKQLLDSVQIRPIYDYVFVDEGQDFPASFVRLCTAASRENRLAWAYDDLQTIFQARTPTAAEIFGTLENGQPKVSFERDVVLYKCYRNPREILVCAHALGFGIYGTRIAQMLENAQHWEDLGYRVAAGDFVQGSEIAIERPEDNSLPLSSAHYEIGEIVSVQSFDKMRAEAIHVAESIAADVADGLRLDDILVVSVDDRNSKTYLRAIAEELRERGIAAHDIHSDAIGLVDFYSDDKVTLSTVHKAKGNEAFMVYVVGIDAIFDTYPSVRERNMLFTAMTRAKGWVRLSGVGEGAARCKVEIDKAIANFPLLRFTYPSPEQLNVMKRDLADDAVRKQEAHRLMERLVDEYGVSAEELGLFVKGKADKTAKKRKRTDDT